MIKMAAAPIYDKNFIFSQNQKYSCIILIFDMQNWCINLNKIYINDDPGLTMTYIAARSNLVAYVFEWGKTVTKFVNGTILRQITKLTEDLYLRKNGIRGFSDPVPGLNTCI